MSDLVWLADDDDSGPSLWPDRPEWDPGGRLYNGPIDDMVWEFDPPSWLCRGWLWRKVGRVAGCGDAAGQWKIFDGCWWEPVEYHDPRPMPERVAGFRYLARDGSVAGLAFLYRDRPVFEDGDWIMTTKRDKAMSVGDCEVLDIPDFILPGQLWRRADVSDTIPAMGYKVWAGRAWSLWESHLS